MRLSKLLFFCFCMLFIGCRKNINSNNQSELVLPDRIDTAIKERIQKGVEHKIYVAKISLNQPIQYKFYSSLNEPKSMEDQFEFGSITKTFTSLIIYKLYQKDLISYEDKISKYLPDSLANTPNIDQIKIKHLLNHTTGLPWFPAHYEMTVEPWNNPFLNFATNDLLSYVKAFNFPEKRTFQYSNLGYGLLTYIIEKITNQTLEECFTEEIIGEFDTSWDLKDRTTIQGFDWNSEFNNWDFPTTNFGIGGLRGTIKDLAAYGIYTLKLIEKEEAFLDLMFRDAIELEPPFKSSIGKGWFRRINQKTKEEFIFHGGWTGGFNSEIILDIKKKEGLVMLSNTSSFIDDLAINYFDTTFDIRSSNKDFSWLLVEELKKGVEIQTALNKIDKSKLNVNRLLELSRYYSSKDLKISRIINEFIMEVEPTNWVAIFELGKYYALIERYDKAETLFEKAIEIGGNEQVIKNSLKDWKENQLYK